MILSHADLDHFNGIPKLLERIAIGRVIRTPSFSEKPAEGVDLVMNVLQDREIPITIVTTGDLIRAGNEVTPGDF